MFVCLKTNLSTVSLLVCAYNQKKIKLAHPSTHTFRCSSGPFFVELTRPGAAKASEV
jgi:hypothetical protein